MPAEFEIYQEQIYQGDDWWKWAVWIEGEDMDLNRIDYVEWTLHPTFPDPIRESHDRGTKFRLETGGWGTFPIRARLQFKDGTSTKLSHHLQLNYPGGEPSLK